MGRGRGSPLRSPAVQLVLLCVVALIVWGMLMFAGPSVGLGILGPQQPLHGALLDDLPPTSLGPRLPLAVGIVESGQCPADAPRAGALCFTEHLKCEFDAFCCPACGATTARDCSHHATTAVCFDAHWLVMSRGNWCPRCDPLVGAGTCDGFCGGVGSTGNCFCDENCVFWNNCCADFAAHCTNTRGRVVGTCKNRCGTIGSTFDCFCEESCVELGNCCDDYERECSAGVGRSAGWGEDAMNADQIASERRGWAAAQEAGREEGQEPSQGTFHEWWAASGAAGGEEEEEPLPPLPDTGGVSWPLPPPAHAAPYATKEVQDSLMYPPNEFPILLLVKDRYETLQQTLNSLASVIGFDRSKLIISQEEDTNDFVTSVIRAFGLSTKNWLHHPTPFGIWEGAEFIAAHYHWAISNAFALFPDARYLVIIEDDMTFSRDFLLYFSHVAPLLDDDPSLWCASAWNDNGFKPRVKDPTRLLRTQWFVGFGWMLSRELYTTELEAHWPQTHWDHWMRDPATNQGRETLFPEVSRNYHIGVYGTHSDYELFSRYFEPIEMHAGDAVGFEQLDEAEQTRFEARLQGMIQSSTALGALEDLDNPPSADFLSLFFEAKKFKGSSPDLAVYDAIAERLAIWHSSGGMTPRGSHNGVVQVRHKGSILFLVPSYSPYFALKPADAVVIDRNHLPPEMHVDDQGSVVDGPPPFELTGGIAPRGKSCDEACGKLKHNDQRYVCDARGFPWLNNCHQLKRAFECTACVPSSGPDQPALDVREGDPPTSKAGVCLWTSDGDFTCAASHPKTRRLCPCRVDTR